MSVTYIDIGVTCQAFTQPSLPSDIQNFYLTDASGNVLNPSSSVPYTTTTKNTLVTVSSTAYAFQARSTLTLLNRDTSALKYLQPQGTSTGTNEASNYEATSSDWSGSGPVIYKSVNYTKSTSDTVVQNLLINQFSYASGFTGTATNMTLTFSKSSPALISPSYFLRRINTSSSATITTAQYLKYDSRTVLDLYKADVSVNDITPLKTYQIKNEALSGGGGYRLNLYYGSTKIPDSEYTIVYNPGSTPEFCIQITQGGGSAADGFYVFDDQTPSDEPLTSQWLLIRDISNVNNYLFVDSATMSFTMGSYWNSGLTPSVLANRTIFDWKDLSPYVSGNNQDIYHWVLGGSVYLKYNGTSLVADSTEPPRDEGWVITSTGAIQYIRKNTTVSNVYVNGSGSVVFPNPANTTNQATNSFRCVKCSTKDQTSGLCLT